jgi:hypothetical protein
MGCKNLWSREVIDGACTKVFRDSQLKKHREVVLFEKEKCLMPQTQDAVSRVIQCRKLDALIKEADEKIGELRRTQHELFITKNRIANGQVAVEGANEKRAFVRKCPVDNCRGFLSTRWKCQICENNICSECNEIKVSDGEHTCDPNNVETVALLKKDTKPCPSCGTMIYKISGCSQMWCPHCHTAFDWRTLKIETGKIHNPHYYEFTRAGGSVNRDNGDIPCGGLPDITELQKYFGLCRRYTSLMHLTGDPGTVFTIHRLVLHIENWGIRNAPRENNQELRIKYLLNEMSEDDMKVILQKNEKAREKARDRENLLTMFCNVTSDLMRQMILKTINTEDFIASMIRLREYTLDAFRVIHKRYNCSTDWISDGWYLVKNSYKKPIVVE